MRQVYELYVSTVGTVSWSEGPTQRFESETLAVVLQERAKRAESEA